MKGKVSGQSRATKVRAAEDGGGKPPGRLRPGGQSPSGPGGQECQERPKPPRESESFVLRIHIVGGIGEKNYILING